MEKKTGTILLSVFVAFFWLGPFAEAQHQHGHGSPPAKGAPASPKGVQTATIEGLKITFEVMSMEEHMKHLQTARGHGEGDHSQTHSFMVTLQDTISKEIISNAHVEYRVSTPRGESRKGKLTWSGDHYGGGFTPKEKGVYQIRLEIKSEGMERKAAFRYTAK